MASQNKDRALVDGSGSKQTHPPSGPDKPSWVGRCIGAVQSHFEKRRAEKKQQTAADRAAKSTARATWAIAALTLVAIAVGVSQYVIFSRQLGEMRATREGGDKSTSDQMEVMRTQAKIMQGQLDQMAAAQRPWLLIDNLSVSDIQQFPVGAGILAFADYRITNIGHSPAEAIFIKTALIFKGIDDFTMDTVPSLCQQQPAEQDRLLTRYSDTMLPGQVVNIGGIWDGATFGHSVEGLVAQRDASLEAGRTLLKQNGLSMPPVHTGETRFDVAPTIIGCVSYRVVGFGTLHRTGFAFDIRDGISTILIAVGQKGEVYNGPPLVVTPSPIGNFSD